MTTTAALPSRLALVVLCLATAACDLADFDPVVPVDALKPQLARLSISRDATRLWAAHSGNIGGAYAQVIRAFDPVTGEMIVERALQKALGGANQWETRALIAAPESGHEDEVWTLNGNGYQIRWNATLTALTDIRTPPPGAVYPCDMDLADTGEVYVTSARLIPSGPGLVDQWVHSLHRRAANGQWTVVELGRRYAPGCARVSFDDAVQRVATLVPAGDADFLAVHDTALSPVYETSLANVPGAPQDIASVSTAVVVATRVTSTEAALVVVDPQGVVMDQIPMDAAAALDIHYDGAQTADVWWSGLDLLGEYAAGKVLLQD